jgi:hypothetical protein
MFILITQNMRARSYDLQASDASKVDLPEDEPTIVKPLIDYMYECEYEPKLPDGKVSRELDEAPTVTGPKLDGLNYDFPHTCTPNCPNPRHLVCQHHKCIEDTCREQCIKFVCKECCPEYFNIYPAPEGDATQLLLHSKMYEIGDKYEVVGLKQLAREKFLRAATKYWNDEQFTTAAYYVFNTTPEEDKGLRDVVSSTISAHMGLLDKPAVESLLNEFNGLAVGILKKRAKDLGWTKNA